MARREAGGPRQPAQTANPAIWRAIGSVFFVAIVGGGAFYLLESRLSPKLYSMQTPMGRAVEAFIVGILSVTRGPIRFYEFQTLSARVLAAVLALSSTFVIAGITAVLASAFTLDSLSSRVSGLQDLHNVRVAALEGSTSSNFLRLNGIAHQTLPDLPVMMEALANDQLEAVVADAACLKYAIHNGKKQGEYTSMSVLPNELQTQNYGFAMQDHSDLTENLNLALLLVRQSDEWHAALQSYLGN